MTVYRRRLRELALKIESAAGTFNTPAVDGSESKLFLIDPVMEWNFETHEQDVMTTHASHFPAVVGKTWMKITGGVYLRRTATGVSEDQYFNLFRCAGMVGTSPSSNLVLKPSSKLSDHKTASMYAYLGNTGSATSAIRVALKGGACNLSAEHIVGEPQLLRFEMWAVYNGFSYAGAIAAVTHEAATHPAFLSASFTYNSQALKIRRFAWDLGNEVVQRESVNSAEGIDYFTVINRNPTFEMDPEWEASIIDLNAHYLAGTESAIAFNIHSTNLTFAAPKAQIKSIRDGDRNGYAIAECSGSLNVR